MRILVLGGGGMLGHKVVQRLGHSHQDLWWTLHGRRDDPALDPVPMLRGANAICGFEAMELERVSGLLRELRPDVVINCLGLVKQRSHATDALAAVTINALLPHRIARALRGWNGRLVHISTDCVFSGQRGAYREDDHPDAVDLYGRSKALGESFEPNVLTLRTSMIGRELKHHASLLDWFLAQRGRCIKGFRRAMWSGVTALHLAEVIEVLLRDHPALHGIHHLASTPLSKHDLLSALNDAYDLGVDIVPDDTHRVDLTLVGARFETATGYRCPPMASLIEDLVADPTPYRPLS